VPEIARARRADLEFYTGDKAGPLVHISSSRITIEINLSEPTAPQFALAAAHLNRFDPKLIVGAMSILRGVSHAISSGAISGEGRHGELLSPLLVESKSEFLSDDVREELSTTFNCPVSNMYGSTETYAIAYTCPMNEMHVLADNAVLELDRADTESQSGEAIVTALNFMRMPFIRYRLGDRLSLISSAGECGIHQPVIRIDRGRVADAIEGHSEINGTNFFYSIFNRLAKEGMDCVNRFRVVQVEVDEFTIQVVPRTDYSETFETAVRHRINKGLSEAKVSFSLLAQLPQLQSGKESLFIKRLREHKG
jgi:phenylacetate-CoA ligase